MKVTIPMGGLPSRYLDGGLSRVTGDGRKLPTGCNELDTILGGGIPYGEVFYIQGNETTGKSSLCEEMALNFSKAGGVSLLFAIGGDHPLPGFSNRVKQEGVEENILLISPDRFSDPFQATSDFLGKCQGDVFCAVDDLSSFPPVKSKRGASRDFSSFLGLLKPFMGRLTLVLVNQVREVGEATVGAVGYRVSMQMCTNAIHLGQHAHILDGETSTIVGLRTTGHVMKQSGKVLSSSHPNRKFNMHVIYSWGIHASA